MLLLLFEDELCVVRCVCGDVIVFGVDYGVCRVGLVVLNGGAALWSL